MIGSYIKYILKRKNEYHLHSPFVYRFATEVLCDNHFYEAYSVLKTQRERVLSDHSMITTIDFGAAAKDQTSISYEKEIGPMARGRSHTLKQCELLFRIVRYFNPTTILELGTAFGMGTSALALGVPDAKICSLEGCPNLSAYARKELDTLAIRNVELKIGSFEDQLDQAIAELGMLDFVFFDGNHREEPTMDYFRKCLAHKNENSVFVFDDIHWSKGMESAWNRIKNDSSTSFSIDLYQFGLIFFKKGFEKQHFVL